MSRRESKILKTTDGNDIVVVWDMVNNSNVFKIGQLANNTELQINGENALLLASFIASRISEFIEE